MPGMRFERAVRYGLVGTVGLAAIALMTRWLIRQVELADGAIGTVKIVIAVGIGTFVALLFLFALMDAFVDEKLETRGDANTAE